MFFMFSCFISVFFLSDKMFLYFSYLQKLQYSCAKKQLLKSTRFMFLETMCDLNIAISPWIESWLMYQTFKIFSIVPICLQKVFFGQIFCHTKMSNTHSYGVFLKFYFNYLKDTITSNISSLLNCVPSHLRALLIVNTRLTNYQYAPYASLSYLVVLLQLKGEVRFLCSL